MRVALLGPVAWRTPPRHYGPWEQVTGLLAEGLVARGVDVTLFATLDSVTSATLDGVCPRGYADDPTWTGGCGRRCTSRTRWPGRRSSTWCTATSTGCRWPSRSTAGLRCSPPCTASPARGSCPPTRAPARPTCRSPTPTARPGLDYVATVHHGDRPRPACRSRRDGGPGLVAFGRIHPDKGTHTAIEIARRGRPAVDHLRHRPGRAVLHPSRWRPHIDGDRVVFLGSVGPADRAEMLGGSAALLHPIAFDEPFGLSVVESMACGTPVVAYRGGRCRRSSTRG